MSTQENPGALIQATLLGKKNGITSRFLLSKLKNIKQTQKSPQKVIFFTSIINALT